MGTPKILISNDDGIAAYGLRALAESLGAIGELWIVAPDRERSAISHAISLHVPLRVRQSAEREYAVDGTPTDCIYLALHHLMDGPPALVISGINHGPNLGNDVLYSGTVSAAMEGALFGHPALAVSLGLRDNRQGPLQQSDFAVAADVAAKLATAILDRPMQPGVLLNVNVPATPREAIRGIKLCRLGYTDWADAVTVRQDPRGRPYYWIGGDRRGQDEIKDSDNNGIADGYVTVTPIHYDVTDYRSFAYARSLGIPGLEKADDGLGDDPLPYPVHPRA
ncbi:MAG: 5'/3'-nucleotidase SurE [Myxococcota bacterium]